jgi:hypothetical protein
VLRFEGFAGTVGPVLGFERLTEIAMAGEPLAPTSGQDI